MTSTAGRLALAGLLLLAVVGSGVRHGTVSRSWHAPLPATAAHVGVGPQLPVTLIDSTGAEVTITSIDRIVPVDGDLAEIVFALGLGDHCGGHRHLGDLPSPGRSVLPDIGYQRALNPEPIAAMEPTVILATDLAQPAETLEQPCARSVNPRRGDRAGDHARRPRQEGAGRRSTRSASPSEGRVSSPR